MTPAEKRLAAHLLDMASETYSNHGCNDLDLAGMLPLADRNALALDAYGREDYEAYYQREEDTGADYRLQDWHAMSLLANKLRSEADMSES